MNPKKKSNQDEPQTRSGRTQRAGGDATSGDVSSSNAPPNLEAFPGIDGEGASENRTIPNGVSGGLWSSPGDGTIGNATEALDARRSAGEERSVGDSGTVGRTRRDDAGSLDSNTTIDTRADRRGNNTGGELSGTTGSVGPARRSDVAGTGGGVAVSAGRGSDVGTVGGGLSDDLSSDVSGGMSGGTMGGSRETDVGGGLSGGMRSGMGTNVSGGIGGSTGADVEGETAGGTTGDAAKTGRGNPGSRKKND